MTFTVYVFYRLQLHTAEQFVSFSVYTSGQKKEIVAFVREIENEYENERTKTRIRNVYIITIRRVQFHFVK